MTRPEDPMRTDYCGELRADDVGREVAVCGWVARRREHGEHLAFVDVRDRTGIVQCVVDGAHDLRSEYVVRVTGAVRRRPEGTVNPNLPTGEVELGPCQVEVLNVAEPPPFPIDERTEVDETVRLRYRYVDLRSERMQRNLRVRATVNSAIRRSMERQGFTEVETPMLIASTPEGARDFVVPSRLSPGSFYALPQSPQLFKQLCMVGGVDRYYQIARCLRDEDLRADRQFEFMQLDAEASFVGQDEVLAFISDAVAEATESVTGERPTAIPSMTWHEAHERFGSDKPDVRFGMELVELTALFAETGFNAFKAPCVKGIRVPGGASTTRNQLDALTDRAKQWGREGARVDAGRPRRRVRHPRLARGQVPQPVRAGGSRHRPRRRGGRPPPAGGRRSGDGVPRARAVAARARPAAGDRGRRSTTCGWSTSRSSNRSTTPVGRCRRTTRSPCRTPTIIARLDQAQGQELLEIRAQSYDLVLNGWELGSGSVRIHRSDIQSRCSSCSASPPRRRSSSSASCSTPSASARPPCRLRLRHRPPGRAAGRRGQHQGGDRVPEDAVGQRSPHLRADAHPLGAAHRARIAPPAQADLRPTGVR